MRNFTKWMALALAIIMCVGIFAGCTPTPTEPQKTEPQQTEPQGTTPKPTVPSVEEMVLTGSPTLEGNAADRLPVKEDIFISVADATGAPLEIGTYGGVINVISGGGSWDLSRPTLETIIRRDTDGSYYPNVIKSYEYSEDYKVWTFHLREGMKWSDGDDFNADDITFWYYMCHINNYDTKASWAALKDGDGFAKLEKVDALTVTWTFSAPKYPADFIENGDFKWCWAPSHWLKDLIPASYYVENPYWENTNLSDEDVLKNAKEKGVDKATVKDLGKELTYYFWNVGGLPTVNSFVLRAGESRNDTVCHMDRNAYYFKVDAKGQQLPYCDAIVFNKTSADGQDQLMFRSGEVDLIGVAMQDIASIMTDMGDKAVLRTFASVDWGGTKVTFNYTHTDKNYADLFNNIKFRQAISIAVDRNELSELISDGFLLPGQCAPQPGNFGYDEEWMNKWTEYDVAGAKKLLEECGLKMGSDGFYDFADGSNFLLTFYSYLDNGAATEYPILQKYYNAIGIETAWKEFEVAAFDGEIDNNTWTAVIGPHTSIGGLSMKDRVAPFVPAQQAAEWYGEYGTWVGTNGAQGVQPTGDFAKLVLIWRDWEKTADSDERDAYNLEIYKIHKKNLWTIAYLQSAGTYNLVASYLKNYPDNLVSCDLYMYANIVHYENLFKAQ
jgi:peptide/nickel transport system substrate-binding protein